MEKIIKSYKMNNSPNTEKSHTIAENEKGNCTQIYDEYKGASPTNEGEEISKLIINEINEEPAEQAKKNNAKYNTQEGKKKPELIKESQHPSGEDNIIQKNCSSDENGPFKGDTSKKDSNEFIGRKTQRQGKKKKSKTIKNNEKIIKPIKEDEFNQDDFFKNAMNAFIWNIKVMIEVDGDIIFNNFQCKEIVGGIIQNELIMKAKLYQVLGYKKKYRKILRKAENKNKRFYYFLTRQFGFLFEKYFLNSRTFIIEGKEVYVKEFKTLNDEIKRRREKVYEEDDELTRNKKINNFIYCSFLIFNNFKGCQRREPRAENLVYYTKNRIAKFLIYTKNEKDSESNFDEEKEKFLKLIGKTSEELKNDDTLKTNFHFFEEGKGFEQFITLKKNIEENEPKGKKVTKSKKKVSKNSSMLMKSNIKESKFKNIESKEINLDNKELSGLDNLETKEKLENIGQKIFCKVQNSAFSIIGNKASGIDNLETKEKLENIEQNIFDKDQNSISSIIMDKTLYNFNYTNWIPDTYSKNSLNENEFGKIELDQPYDNRNMNTITANHGFLREDNDRNLHKNEEYIIDESFISFKSFYDYSFPKPFN